MRNNKKTLLASGAVLVAVLLFIAPRTLGHTPAGSPEPVATERSATVDVYASLARKNLDLSVRGRIDSLMGAARYDSCAAIWDRARRPDIAAWCVEKSAASAKTAAAWLTAGNRYYYAVQFCQDQSEIPVLYASAERCFEKTLTYDSHNSDARIMLATCLVESSADPMKGISLLREVEQTDSNNVKLQLAFAFFSVKSGQLPKAVSRFRKVLAIDSSYVEAYLHLADAYEQMSMPDSTISALERYSERTSDVTARLEVRKYIQQLKSNH